MSKYIVVTNYVVSKHSKIMSDCRVPCPFCGSSAIVGLGEIDHYMNYCMSCHIAHDEILTPCDACGDLLSDNEKCDCGVTNEH